MGRGGAWDGGVGRCAVGVFVKKDGWCLGWWKYLGFSSDNGNGWELDIWSKGLLMVWLRDMVGNGCPKKLRLGKERTLYEKTRSMR